MRERVCQHIKGIDGLPPYLLGKYKLKQCNAKGAEFNREERGGRVKSKGRNPGDTAGALRGRLFLPLAGAAFFAPAEGGAGRPPDGWPLCGQSDKGWRQGGDFPLFIYFYRVRSNYAQ